MPVNWRTIRQYLLTPAMAETSFATRGFHARDEASRERLESVGVHFLTGYGHAMAERGPAETTDRLETVEPDMRGFAYEGAAMGFAVLDGLTGGSRVARFLAGPADRHVYMVHVGMGWAMARLPRWRRRAVQPTDRLLGWLALDGYGFHQAYFHTARYVREHHRGHVGPWPGDPAGRWTGQVVDQGIGRALWFVAGADPDRVADTIDRFPAERREDLYSGTALAATYAGGASREVLLRLAVRGAAHAPAMAQGSAFAAQARGRAGLTTEHTGVATEVFCGTPAAQAAKVTQTALDGLDHDGPVPAYLVWRQRIAEQFVTLGRC
ncbi:enediyne biosynthesis protein [Micromonospora craterilacus]|uniref:Enediyne biosynthesis protein n=1 Tax=Micromonospora craterilacus TaxID=1655439 RepID=A0A2W2F4I3_9ACTN|nr:DUF1702 family protein [Micromonospora craterilacus]PZG24359.1 enediyne biosynthesis protein [Micromonospora craterilacus]